MKVPRRGQTAEYLIPKKGSYARPYKQPPSPEVLAAVERIRRTAKYKESKLGRGRSKPSERALALQESQSQRLALEIRCREAGIGLTWDRIRQTGSLHLRQLLHRKLAEERKKQGKYGEEHAMKVLIDD